MIARLHAELVEGLEHQHVGEPARRAAAQRQADARARLAALRPSRARSCLPRPRQPLEARAAAACAAAVAGRPLRARRPAASPPSGWRARAASWRRKLSLAGAAAARISLEAVEVQHVELVDLDVDVDVGLPRLELLAHDRALQDLRGRHQRGEGRRLRRACRDAVGAPLTSMATVMSASPSRTSKGSGLTSPPSISSAAIDA